MSGGNPRLLAAGAPTWSLGPSLAACTTTIRSRRSRSVLDQTLMDVGLVCLEPSVGGSVALVDMVHGVRSGLRTDSMQAEEVGR